MVIITSRLRCWDRALRLLSMLARCAIYCHFKVLVGRSSRSPSNVVDGVYLLSHAGLNQSAYRDMRSWSSATLSSGSAEATVGNLAGHRRIVGTPAGARPAVAPTRRGGWFIAHEDDERRYPN
jgi:hypothetical protein